MAPEIRPKSFRAFEKWATGPSKGLFSDDKEGKERKPGFEVVKTTKSLPKKDKYPTKGLLTYRSNPLACGYSQAELLRDGKPELPRSSG